MDDEVNLVIQNNITLVQSYIGIYLSPPPTQVSHVDIHLELHYLSVSENDGQLNFSTYI